MMADAFRTILKVSSVSAALASSALERTPTERVWSKRRCVPPRPCCSVVRATSRVLRCSILSSLTRRK